MSKTKKTIKTFLSLETWKTLLKKVKKVYSAIFTKNHTVQKTRPLINSGVEKQETDTFRISAKKIFLTYSKVDSNMSPSCLLQLLQNKFNHELFDYVVSKESHVDGTPHFHVILISNYKFEIRNKNFLDIEFKGQTFHGNYQPIKFLSRCFEYICKDKQYITNIGHLREGKLLDPKEYLLQRVEYVGFEKALLEYAEKYPKKAFSASSVSTLKKNFKDMQKLQSQQEDDILESPFNMEHFHLNGALKEWTNNPNLFKKKALLMVGQSGIGKTAFSKVFCKHHNYKTLIITHKEDFQRIDPSYDAIIVDDANFNEFSDTQKLALVDNSAPKTIRVLYQTVRKKKGVVMLIIMNHMQYREIHELFKQEAFARRVVIFEPKRPFMINVNIQIQNIQNIHNGDINHNTFDKLQEADRKLIEENKIRGQDIYQNTKF